MMFVGDVATLCGALMCLSLCSDVFCGGAILRQDGAVYGAIRVGDLRKYHNLCDHERLRVSPSPPLIGTSIGTSFAIPLLWCKTPRVFQRPQQWAFYAHPAIGGPALFVRPDPLSCDPPWNDRLEIYSYWNQGGPENVLSMLLMLGDRYLLQPGVAPSPGEVLETPTLGLFHPLADRYFATPSEYMAWYEGEQARVARDGVEKGTRHSVAPPGSPRVAVLLYRKHVITRQGYISQMIRCVRTL